MTKKQSESFTIPNLKLKRLLRTSVYVPNTRKSNFGEKNAKKDRYRCKTEQRQAKDKFDRIPKRKR